MFKQECYHEDMVIYLKHSWQKQNDEAHYEFKLSDKNTVFKAGIDTDDSETVFNIFHMHWYMFISHMVDNGLQYIPFMTCQIRLLSPPYCYTTHAYNGPLTRRGWATHTVKPLI